MKVFLSWSKPKSQRFAELLRDWLPEVIQQIEPWLSSSDIEKGQRWSVEVGAQLGALSQGILCVTAENAREPWLNFEAGALAKSLDNARVRPLLLDLKPSDLVGPLAQFQATIATNKEDMRRLAASLNAACEPPLDELRLGRSFSRVWSAYEERVSEILNSPSLAAEAGPRPVEDMVAEILDQLRSMQRSAAWAQEPTGDGRFGQALRRFRQLTGMDINDLAAATRISVTDLQVLESGLRSPTIRQAADLDKFFSADGQLVALGASGPSGLGGLIPDVVHPYRSSHDE